MSLREWQEVQEVLRPLAAFYQSGAGEGATLRRGDTSRRVARIEFITLQRDFTPQGGASTSVLEREKGIEPSTSTLGRLHSAIELLPL